jgi:hypoxanthine phosphoribosyltransferase
MGRELMSRMVFGRRIMFREDILDAAIILADKISRHQPESIVYLERGGKTVGRAVAEALNIQAHGMDLRYPLSRLDMFPLNLLTFPVKAIAYHHTEPDVRSFEWRPPRGPMALVDDSASSGRSLHRARRVLLDSGVAPESIITAVVRCGRRARSVVDYFEFEEPAIFLRG